MLYNIRYNNMLYNITRPQSKTAFVFASMIMFQCGRELVRFAVTVVVAVFVLICFSIYAALSLNTSTNNNSNTNYTLKPTTQNLFFLFKLMTIKEPKEF